MSSGSPKRHRSELALPPGHLERTLQQLRRNDVILRISLCTVAALLMWLSTGAWVPPFVFRTGDVPSRTIVARTDFSQEDPEATEALINKRLGETICVYEHDVRPLLQLRQALKDQVFQTIRAESYEKLDQQIWQQFVPREDSQEGSTEQLFTQFREAFADDLELVKFDQIVRRAFEDFEVHGFLDEADLHRDQDGNPYEGNQFEIDVYPVGNQQLLQRVEVKDVRINYASETLRQRLIQEFKSAMVTEQQAEVVTRTILAWLRGNQLPTTLTLDVAATEARREEVRESTETVMKTFKPGDALVEGGQEISVADIELLREEHEQLAENMGWPDWLSSLVADIGMYLALYILCGFFVYYRQPELLVDTRKFATLLGLAVVAVAACSLVSRDQWRAEIVPLLLFGMILTIAYGHELALLIAASIALVVVLSLGQGLTYLVIYVATAAAAIQLLDRVRSRTKLIYVGLAAGTVATLTTIGVTTVSSQAFGASSIPEVDLPLQSTFWETSTWTLVSSALWYGFCAVLTGVLMTGLLPFVEKLFDIQTDISLLELGDAAHPLLQELVRRAPGTYNHSINVASIGEAAADAIHANGLLVRVGAYFHDIGKILKPGYYIENQTQGADRHASLVPAMSTLVIIAHVKDGADLARQHRLPQSIIDFIEQHHGTTLVEYFYNQAAKQSEADPDVSQVDETNFRYPGPKPQTKEAGVLMLADAAESASRTLVEPTPARLESLVRDIVMKRLLDDQFDDCGLTMRELRIVEESLIKSLTAVYHGRVKYPEKQHTA